MSECAKQEKQVNWMEVSFSMYSVAHLLIHI